MTRVFKVEWNGQEMEVFVTRVDHDVWRQLRRSARTNGWLVSIPQWYWSCLVQDMEPMDDVRFWIGRLASAYTDDEEGILKVAEAIARRC